MAAPLTPDAKARLHAFLSGHRLAVLASVGPQGEPQSALINIAVTPELEIVFETTSETRKFLNIERDPRVSLVIGWDGQETVQYEGLAAQPDGRRGDMARQTFIRTFPSRENDELWPGNSYFLVTPVWLRFSSYYRPRFSEEYALAPPPPPPRAGFLTRLKARLAGG